MDIVVSIRELKKSYANGFEALKGVDLDIRRGEILALLGPNGAGKTTMISIICGLINRTSGSVLVDGYDVETHFRETRRLIGLVPQELTTDQFETVFNTVSFSRGLHGCKKDPALIERVLKSLSLWDKRNNMLRELSGGMKRRVLIAKALAHEPKVLFLDEPTAGVDVSLRHGMWRVVEELRSQGVTIIMTTHYIEEAEEIADRVGVINQGQLLLVEDKDSLMHKLGRKQVILQLAQPLAELSASLSDLDLSLTDDGNSLTYSYGTSEQEGEVAILFKRLSDAKIEFADLSTRKNSLEDIFVSLVETSAGEKP
jgi:ABC-2 type transport system ATP-binding protein